MIEFYVDKAGEHRWSIKADNNKIIGASSEGFSSLHEAKENLQRVQAELAHDRSQNADDEMERHLFKLIDTHMKTPLKCIISCFIADETFFRMRGGIIEPRTILLAEDYMLGLKSLMVRKAQGETVE